MRMLFPVNSEPSYNLNKPAKRRHLVTDVSFSQTTHTITQ